MQLVVQIRHVLVFRMGTRLHLHSLKYQFHALDLEMMGQLLLLLLVEQVLIHICGTQVWLEIQSMD